MRLEDSDGEDDKQDVFISQEERDQRLELSMRKLGNMSSINTPQLTFLFDDNCCSAVLRRHGKYLVQREKVNVNWSINC